MEPVFEIREYLDEAGQTVGSEVVDISKEMEMMRQFEAQLDPQALDAAVVDVRAPLSLNHYSRPVIPHLTATVLIFPVGRYAVCA